MDTEPPGLLFFFDVLDVTQITSGVMLIALLACSALISGAEVAFFSLTPSDFETNEEKGIAKKLGIVQRLLARPKKLLATILVANNFINIAIVLLFDSLSDDLFSGIESNFYGIDVR
ncbi:MAG TPA: gliding motility-associated protein GldE, partial [Aequorivita sp.]|nr:gliding motility-associated protein GldE [Aequorivita sp.]